MTHFKLALITFFNISLLLTTAAPKAFAWGSTGHRVVGEIAESMLDPETKKQVHALTMGHSLAQVSTWADEIKSLREWDAVSSWHYLSFPPKQALATVAFVPPAKKSSGHLLWAIREMVDVLKGKGPLKGKNHPSIENRDALKFLVHFIGDLHQPLHIGYEEDRGGNNLRVFWFHQGRNLHQVWDEEMIDQSKLSFTELTRFILEEQRSERPLTLAQGQDKNQDKEKFMGDTSYLLWASESRAALPKIYEVGQGELGYEYQFQHFPFLKQRLYLAGQRLALILNEVFARPQGEVKKTKKIKS